MLEYDFQYFMHPLPVDIPVLCVAPRKTVLQAPYSARLRPGAVAVPPPPRPAAELQRFRMLIGAARESQFAMPAAVVEQVERDFVESRQHGGAEVTQDSMHRWLTLSRLLCVSHGETALSWQRWQDARRLDALMR